MHLAVIVVVAVVIVLLVVVGRDVSEAAEQVHTCQQSRRQEGVARRRSNALQQLARGHQLERTHLAVCGARPEARGHAQVEDVVVVVVDACET
jgi:hypothetical protein